MNHCTPTISRQQGFSMIEILISLVIIATALLGTAGLQLYAMKVGKSSEFRTQAIFLASDLAERMEANKAAAITGGYVVAATSAPSIATTDCGSNPCHPAALAAWDISAWENAIVAAGLPEASWKVTRTISGNPSTYKIVINWVDRRTDTNYGTYDAASSFGINAAGTGERFSYTATRTVAN